MQSSALKKYSFRKDKIYTFNYGTYPYENFIMYFRGSMLEEVSNLANKWVTS